ncbi:site-specific integrase [Galbibacter mesophilus]|uniref:site-specific integrase n=1 Tax=Galbibacter mesophilus TaxID=379069 RepID=UPI00191F3B0D|nr:site-specific integrase [Galbibacter mesophilus]MCM5664281.1 site-specific integrase [Galbibacter mesophilus]
MKVSFHLRTDKFDKDGYAPIRTLISANGFKLFKAVPEVKCDKMHWDERTQRIIPSKKKEPYNYAVEYNQKIDEFAEKLRKLQRYILLNDITPTKEYIKEKLNSGLKGITLANEFLPSFDEYIETGRSTKAERTLIRYGTAKNFIEEFSIKKDYPLRFETITIDFFEKIRDYSFQEKGIMVNYFDKIISILKTFMNWAFDRGYHENLDFKKFKTSQQEVEVIYLTMDELMKLYNHKFKSKKLEHVRDTYCFGCFTGLRFSDIKQLRASNIFEDHIKLNIQKTKTIDHIIPLNNYSKAILDKYKNTLYEPLPVISSQKFNSYIKECCADAEIDTPTTITRYVGQKRIDTTEPKHKFITSHTARKTFVTNSLILGMKEMVVRNITGHKKESTFKRYVKIAEDFKQNEMDNTWNKIQKDDKKLDK